MDITWDKKKNSWLQVNRRISFEEISGKLLNGNYIDILENPTRDNQMYFIMKINDYTWVVPFLIDEKERIVLKTAFPSRKFHNRYGGRDE
ncbi:MAG: toxin [Deltaproteobacteria bacterium]|jgi:disulfide oxidoreductase YuzD|nr:toxin [Deltaproteobacteria bacterium]